MVAKRIINDFETPFQANEQDLNISVSIGIAIFPDHGDNVEELMKKSDLALYYSKENGRKQFMIYDQRMIKKCQ